ncbi:hypothetical protein H8959_018307 [Pygathrix nigripes]
MTCVPWLPHPGRWVHFQLLGLAQEAPCGSAQPPYELWPFLPQPIPLQPMPPLPCPRPLLISRVLGGPVGLACGTSERDNMSVIWNVVLDCPGCRWTRHGHSMPECWHSVS